MDTIHYTGLKTKSEIINNQLLKIGGATLLFSLAIFLNNTNLSASRIFDAVTDVLMFVFICYTISYQKKILSIDIDPGNNVLKINYFNYIFLKKTIAMPLEGLKYTYKKTSLSKTLPKMVLDIIPPKPLKNFTIYHPQSNLHFDTLNKLVADLDAITIHPTS